MRPATVSQQDQELYHQQQLRFAWSCEVLSKQQIDPAGKVCLDIGCGSGNMTLALKKGGALKSIGIDVDLKHQGTPYFQELAQENDIHLDNCYLVEGIVGLYDFGGERFDLVTMHDVLEHVADPAQLFKAVHQLLKPHGIFFISTSPLYFSPAGHHCWEMFPRELAPWAHLAQPAEFAAAVTRKSAWFSKSFWGLNRLTVPEIAALTDEAGFETVKQEVGLAPERAADHPDQDLLLATVKAEADLYAESITLILSARPALTCSVIINTFNRAAPLRRLLASLARLRDARFEIVVVNGPSTDATASVLEQYAARIKIVACPTRNLSQSRNLGLSAAAGEVVVFIDDDALPVDAQWLARYQGTFEKDSAQRLGALGGPVLQGDTAWHEFNGGLTTAYGQQIFDQAQPGERRDKGSVWLARVQGCNCAFRRSALVQIGGFDEQFGYYHDETDVCVRLARAGYATQHLADNPVRHYPARATETDSLRTRAWEVIARSDTYFALKNGPDAWPRRLATTLALAPRKHFAQEGLAYALSSARRLPVLARLSRGYAGGLWAGLFEARRLADLSATPPAFKPLEALAAAHPLRIALLSQEAPVQARYGGIARYTYDLALGLFERGHEVHLFCKDTQALRHQGLGFYIHGISADSGPGHASGAPARPVLDKNLRHALAIVDRLRALYAEQVEFDVVHAPNWDAEGVALIRAQIYPVTLVLATPLAQSIVAEQWPLTDDLRDCVALDRWQIEHADVVCTPSAGVWQSYTTLMGMPREAMQAWRVVPQGIVPEPAWPPAPAARRQLLFVGRLERRKGIHTLLAVLPALLRDAPDWECHLVGNDQIPLAEGGTFRERFLAKHAGAPWLKRVVFHGIVSEQALRERYQQCDLFVAPSLFESYGLIYQEAMQYGKAVVGCRVGGVPEVVADGVHGLLVTADTPAELQAALSSLMRDDARRARLGQAGAERVHQQVNYRTMAAGMEQAYAAAIEAVGEARRMRRARLWPRALKLGTPSSPAHLLGPWHTREAANGHIYQLGQPQAILTVLVQSPIKLEITALRHAWSGVLEIGLEGGPYHYLDLYCPGERQFDATDSYRLAAVGSAGRPVSLTLRVLGERNPASFDCQVWLKRVAIAEEVDDV